MELKKIESFTDLKKNLESSESTFLLLYKSQSEQSECAINNIMKLEEKAGLNVLSADVNFVRDIHEKYSIDSVPALLHFDKQKLVKVFKGCHEFMFFKSLFNNSLYSSVKKEKKPNKRVIVYSTPTCPHCTTAKNYLKGLKIPFRDVNVAQDQKMAEAMVKKSGQQGVPQIEINGRVVVGFNKQKIDELLQIR